MTRLTQAVADPSVTPTPAAQPTVTMTHVVTAAAPGHAAARPGGFRLLLAELNPLQYIPVVGTLYRAVTGDKIPETAREIGSLVVSGLTGGPVGVAANLVTFGLEQATGIDPERIAQHVLAGLGPAHAPPHPTHSAQMRAAPPPPPSGPAAGAWSAAQLSAYGVTTSRDGTLKLGTLQGSDVLNELELTRPGWQA
jgi:hypothetical protein